MQHVMSSTQAEAEKQPLNVLPSNNVHSKKHKILIIYTIKSMTMTYICKRFNLHNKTET
jgi:hypothetical protein